MKTTPNEQSPHFFCEDITCLKKYELNNYISRLDFVAMKYILSKFIGSNNRYMNNWLLKSYSNNMIGAILDWQNSKNQNIEWEGFIIPDDIIERESKSLIQRRDEFHINNVVNFFIYELMKDFKQREGDLKL